ncbi:condensation domain-containing protein [Corynebacterium marquesiae]
MQYNRRQLDLISAQAIHQNAALNLNGLYSFPEPPDENLLRKSIQFVSDHFSSLNTVATFREGKIVPTPTKEKLKIEAIDGYSMREQYDIIYRQARVPFNLFAEPPFRAFLFKSDGCIDQMLLQFHHVASDWWSFRIIHQTLTEFYNSKGKFSSPIDNLKEYNDIHCDEHVDAVVEKFWKTQLQAGIFRESIVGKKGSSSKHLEFAICQDVAPLEREAKRSSITFFEYLFLLYAEQLANSLKSDIIINVPVGNRNSGKFVSTVGYIMNVVPVRCVFHEGCLDRAATLSNLRTAIRYAETPRSVLANWSKQILGDTDALFSFVFMFLRDNIGSMHMPANASFMRIYPGVDEDAHVLTLRERDKALSAVIESKDCDPQVERATDNFIKKIMERANDSSFT